MEDTLWQVLLHQLQDTNWLQATNGTIQVRSCVQM